MILKFCAFLHFWSVALWVFVGHGFQPCWYTSSPVGRLRLHLWDLQSGPCCRSTRVISTSNCGLIGGTWWDMVSHGYGGIWIGLGKSLFISFVVMVAATLTSEAELVFWTCFSRQGWMLPPGRLSALANLWHPDFLIPFNSAVSSANSIGVIYLV